MNLTISSEAPVFMAFTDFNASLTALILPNRQKDVLQKSFMVAAVDESSDVNCLVCFSRRLCSIGAYISIRLEVAVLHISSNTVFSDFICAVTLIKGLPGARIIKSISSENKVHNVVHAVCLVDHVAVAFGDISKANVVVGQTV